MTTFWVLFAVFMPVVIFWAAYKMKGLKTALITTGVVLVGILVLYMGMIHLIVISMD